MKTLLALSLAVMVTVGACGEDDEMTILTDADSGSEIAVDQGERFELHLESNPSTGYAWEIDAMSTPNLVELRSQRFLDDTDTDTDTVGEPGIEVFEFEATGEGAGILRLAYLRPFEDAPVPERVAEFIVRIDDAPWPPDDVPEPPGTSSATAPVEIPALIADGPVDGVTVAGFVLWTDEEARFCELLAESFPPQCGGEHITIANPDDLVLELEDAQGVRWTQGRVELSGSFDGTTLTVDS